MTIVEALKQAESKFRSVLGLPLASDDDVILFSRSPFAECYVIRRFDSIESTENGFWKIIVSDISGKVRFNVLFDNWRFLGKSTYFCEALIFAICASLS